MKVLFFILILYYYRLPPLSKHHRLVSQALHSLWLPRHSFHVLTHDEEFTVDIMLEFQSDMIAMEIVGPMDFTANTKRPLGATVMRKKLLEERGLKVLSMPFHELQRASRSDFPDDMRSYVSESLRTLIVSGNRMMIN